MKPDGLHIYIKSTMESWFCYNLFFYFTESFYAIPLKYCKRKALSPQRNLLSHILTCGDSEYSPVYYACFYCLISFKYDSGKQKRKRICDKTHFWCSVYESFSIDITFRLIKPPSPHHLAHRSPSGAACLVRTQRCDLPLSGSSVPFSSTSLHIEPVSPACQRCSCTKACFWFYQRLM